MIDPLLLHAISAGFAFLLLGAAWHKHREPAAFAAVLTDYRLLPPAAVPFAARAIFALEVLIGIAWLSGLAVAAAGVATAAVMAAYGIAIAINLLRGRSHIGCGCGLGGASADGQPLAWGLVLRNAVLLAIALIAVVPPAERSLGATDWMTLGATLLAAAFLYLGASQLLANGAAIRARRRSHG